MADSHIGGLGSASTYTYLVGEASGVAKKIVSGAGTSFPGSPASGDRFYRSDRKIQYVYDGTRWLSEQLFVLPFGSPSTLNDGKSASTFQMAFVAPPFSGVYSFYLETLRASTKLTNGTTASNYFTLNFYSVETSAGTLLGSLSTQNDTTNNWTSHSTAVGTVLTSAVTELHMDAVETGAATGAQFIAQAIGRLVG